ncbi:hypothetical protein AVEN_17190-1 [Araneus ventricosus]|uniref:Uncharacterized protein n=1 Tax=Araneus ventricosus TaxID=182803 RepID=A0A4Y2DRP5_ARAVE|nr:hypothetical protein AVEN_17190-1 [Araneus ventricosus]
MRGALLMNDDVSSRRRYAARAKGQARIRARENLAQNFVMMCKYSWLPFQLSGEERTNAPLTYCNISSFRTLVCGVLSLPSLLIWDILMGERQLPTSKVTRLSTVIHKGADRSRIGSTLKVALGLLPRRDETFSINFSET